MDSSKSPKGLKGETEAKALREWIKEPRNVWLYAFCAERQYSRRAADELRKRDPVFQDAWNDAKSLIVHKVLSGGLFKDMDTWMAKWYLATNYPDDFPKENDTTQFVQIKGVMDKIVDHYSEDKSE